MLFRSEVSAESGARSVIWFRPRGNDLNEVSAGSPHFFFVSFSIHWIVWSCAGVQREYVNGNREQLEWAINYLEANYQANFADNTEHGSIDWMVKTSSLDPEERVVTQHL